MPDPVPLVNRDERGPDTLTNVHARLEETELVWSVAVSGPGVKAWLDGRRPLPRISGTPAVPAAEGKPATPAVPPEQTEAYERRATSIAESVLVEATAFLKRRVAAAMAVRP